MKYPIIMPAPTMTNVDTRWLLSKATIKAMFPGSAFFKALAAMIDMMATTMKSSP